MIPKAEADSENMVPKPSPSPDLAALMQPYEEENGENKVPISATPDRSQNQSSTSALSVSLNQSLQHSRSDATSGFQLSYQTRHPVEAFKYITRRDERTDAVSFECTVCHGMYKHRKSLNKHWKDKHPDVTEEMVAPRTASAVAQLPPLRDLTAATSNAQNQPVQAHLRRSLRRSSNDVSLQMQKRRRSEFPQPSSSSTFVQPTPSDVDQPLDLSMHPPPSQISVAEPLPPANSNRDATLTLLQASISALSKEPSTVQSLKDASYGTRALLFATGSLLFHEAKPEPSELSTPQNGASVSASHGVTAAVDRRRVEGGPLHCPLCPFTARWQSEVKAHVVNHSTHRLFGCMFCDYRAKWKYDVVKHADKCPNTPRRRPGSKDDVVYFPPPPGDILVDFFPSASQVSGAASADETSTSTSSQSTTSSGSSANDSSDPEDEKPLKIAED